MNKRIGFTSTVPVEVIFAAGLVPVDLNNIFINSDNPLKLVVEAERKGFPRNLCAWTKGLYSVVVQSGIKRVICISEGDCSSSSSMCDVLEASGIEIINFAYPTDRNKDELGRHIHAFAKKLGATENGIKNVSQNLNRIRRKLARLDKLTWNDRKVNGMGNHQWLVSASDFNGDYVKFESDLDVFLEAAETRKPNSLLPLAYVGVPPIISDFYLYLNELGADVVFNETQRQFACLHAMDEIGIVNQYIKYTYPYGINYRLESDILPQIRKRSVRGVISYVQSFCHRQIENIILRQNIDVPFLVLEADKPGKLDNRNKIRLEAFMEML